MTLYIFTIAFSSLLLFELFLKILLSNKTLYKSSPAGKCISSAPAPLSLPLLSNTQFCIVRWKLESSGVRAKLVGFIYMALPWVPRLARKDHDSKVSCLMFSMNRMDCAGSKPTTRLYSKEVLVISRDILSASHHRKLLSFNYVVKL